MPKIQKPSDLYPKVGIAVMIIKHGQILLGLRLKSHGVGEYSFPGGHMEYLESFTDTTRREVREETGLEIKNIRFACLANVKRYAPKHYVYVGLIADWKSGQPQAKEPDKCAGWNWYDFNKLPSPLFETITITIEAYKTGRNYWDQ